MNWMMLFISVVGGCLLGVVYFAGLWVTVGKVVSLSKYQTYLLIISSFVVRTLFVLSGFYFLLAVTGWEVLAAGLPGFMLTKVVLVRKWGLNDLTVSDSGGEKNGI